MHERLRQGEKRDPGLPVPERGRRRSALCRKGVPVRLCKGAYREPATVAFPRKSQVNENYRRLTEVLLERGVYPALATHDPKMIDHALRFAAAQGNPQGRALNSRCSTAFAATFRRGWSAEGYRLRLYVPYGDAWYPYFMRRLAERPANLLFLAKNLVWW